MSNVKAWKEVERKVAYKKYSRTLEEVAFRLPDGTVDDYIIDTKKPAVCVLGLTKDHKVVLVRQFRPGPQAILDELPGGYVDPGEDHKVAAYREFKEETGYDGEIEFVGSCLDDAYSTMDRHCYVMRNCVKVTEPQHTMATGDDGMVLFEHAEIVLLSVEGFRKKLRSGRMTDVEVGYIGLDHLNLL